MSQQPSDHYKRSIQVPAQDGGHRGVQVYPVELANETPYYDPRSRTNSSVSDAQHQQWYSMRPESDMQAATRSDHHGAQHMQTEAHLRKEARGFEHAPWREGTSQTAGAFYTQDSQPTPFLSSPPAAFQPPRESQQGLSWDPDVQARRRSESGYDHARRYEPAPGSRRRETAPMLLSGADSPMSPGHEHHGSPMISRHPSLQTFGPYTTTVLQSGRNAATIPAVGDHNRPRSPSHIPHAVHQQPHLSVRSTDSASRVIEPHQYVVPSSRIPRADLAPHTPSASQYNMARASQSPEDLSETKPKRRRANAAQLQLLNDTYARTMFPTTEERADIARRINMTPRQVQIWFQNRRQASRQNQLEHEAPAGSAFEGMYNEGQADYLHGPEDD